MSSINERPERMWKTCLFDGEGQVMATGEGTIDLYDRFSILANGMTIEVIVVYVEYLGRYWMAQDVASFERSTKVLA